MKRKLSLFLAIVMLVTLALTACKDSDSASTLDQVENYYGTKEADKFVVNQAAASYVVVLPADAMEMETFASEELVMFMEQSTGCEMSVVTDTAVPAGSKYISLGRTSQFAAAFADQDLTSVDGTFSSYFIASKDDNIYIVSSDDHNGYGVLYGVYDLLHDLVLAVVAEAEVGVDDRGHEVAQRVGGLAHPPGELAGGTVEDIQRFRERGRHPPGDRRILLGKGGCGQGGPGRRSGAPDRGAGQKGAPVQLGLR